METWSELGGVWRFFAMVLIIGLPLVLTFPLLIKTNPDKRYAHSVCVVGVVFSTVWAIVLTLALNNSRQSYYSPSGVGFGLAIVEKGTDRIVARSLEMAQLKPWPLPTRYRVVEYPTRFTFISNLQPITRNPKVVPLVVQVVVDLTAMRNLHGLEDYILHQQRQRLDERIFKRHTFDLLQHRLPQEVSEKINPFDESSVAEFQEFLAKELNQYLVMHKVTEVKVSLQHR